MSTDAFTTVRRKPPGRNCWRCDACSKQEPFKSDACGGCYNGAEAEQCRNSHNNLQCAALATTR